MYILEKNFEGGASRDFSLVNKKARRGLGLGPGRFVDRCDESLVKREEEARNGEKKKSSGANAGGQASACSRHFRSRTVVWTVVLSLENFFFSFTMPRIRYLIIREKGVM